MFLLPKFFQYYPVNHGGPLSNNPTMKAAMTLTDAATTHSDRRQSPGDSPHQETIHNSVFFTQIHLLFSLLCCFRSSIDDMQAKSHMSSDLTVLIHAWPHIGFFFRPRTEYLKISCLCQHNPEKVIYMSHYSKEFEVLSPIMLM